MYESFKQSEPGCSMKTAIKNFFSYYATFSGRSSRSEYWYWALFSILVMIPFYIMYFVGILNYDHSYYDYNGNYCYDVDESAQMLAIAGISVLGLWTVLTLIPNLALLVRRLHDTSRSGWWYFIAFIPFIGEIILIVFLLQGTEKYTTIYGGVKGRTYHMKDEYVLQTERHVPQPEYHAPQPAPKPDVTTNNPLSGNTASDLEKYGKMFQQGLLTQEEFDAIKKRLLNL